MSTFDPRKDPRGRTSNAGSFSERTHSDPETTLGAPEDWPAIGSETLDWESRYAEPSALERYGPHPQTYTAAVPPLISGRALRLSPQTAALARAAENELIRFDASLNDEMTGFAPLLLRSEAAASSQIEHLSASARAILTAEIGDTSKRNATEIVGNTRAMQSALALADELTPGSVRKMHEVLMGGTNHAPGDWRTEPVWIGTSARSPVGAAFVAPRFERVPALMDDVMKFARRDDLPVLSQVAIAHAQFETIHPFTDGNGRTGRALVQSMLRGKDITRSVTVPVSAGLLTDVNAYHDALTAYRAGNVEPIVEQMAVASDDAIRNARTLVGQIRETTTGWREQAKPRTGSQLEKILDYAARQPVFTAATASADLGIGTTNIYPHLRKLAELGILKQKSEYKIGQVWRSDDVLAALDQFVDRAGRRRS
ncbi:Fic family protein [Agromyces lapidis]|uniref:Fic family protein n=1 Tax=Agromyces lapidis TaxID=279574 RepID=A0ABV5SPG7_9MICO|nr:Fic family protein [Agromyces lapidis]